MRSCPGNASRLTLVPEGAIPGNHGADDALAAHDIFADRGINVEYDVNDDGPHAQMMPGVNVLGLAEERYHPAEEAVSPGSCLQAFSIECEACDDHKNGDEKENEKHQHARNRIVSDVAMGPW